MLKYTDTTQNTYVQSRSISEIMAFEKCGLLGVPRNVRPPWRHTRPLRMPGSPSHRDAVTLASAYSTVALTSQDKRTAAACVKYLETNDKYDSSASIFVAQFNGFMSLTS
jgi:hypothetical protein